MSIRQRTVAGFSIIVIFVVLSCVLGFAYTISVERVVDNVIQNSARHETLIRVDQKWLEISTEVDNVLLTRQSVLIEGRLKLAMENLLSEIQLMRNSFLFSKNESAKNYLTTIDEITELSVKLDDAIDRVSKDIEQGKWASAQYLRHNDLASLQRRFDFKMNRLHSNLHSEIEASMNNAVQTMKTMRIFWVITALMALFVGIMGDFVTSRSIVSPISKLVDASKAIEGGDFSFRVKMSRGNEFDILAKAFNDMTTRFQDLIHTLEQEIAEKNRAEIALIESEKRYRDIYENAIEGIFQSTVEGRFIDANPALINILGYDSRKDLIENCKNIEKQLYVASEDRKKYISDILQNGKVVDREIQLFRKNAQKIWVSISTRLVYDDEGNPFYLEGFVSDITERKKLFDQLSQSQKMEAIGRLAGGIAHDFNNILTIIIGYCDLLLRENPAESTKSALEQMMAGGERGQRLTGQLLAFSRKQIIKPRTIDLNGLITRQHDMFRRILGEDIETKLFLQENLWKIRMDPGQIEQVIINIVVNARDAMPDGGILTIETSNAEFDFSSSKSKAWVEPGKYVLVSISDNGTGMDETVKSLIFEPFFTTKEKDKGTGLGLSTVYGIIKQNHSYVYVYSELGKGSTFKCYFPKVEDEGETESDKNHPMPEVRINETVLLVEDDPGVRNVTKETLASFGYRVFTADNGKEAIETFNTNSEEISILLTDVVMPNMSGKELAQNLLKKKKQLKVVFFSGYTENTIVQKGVLDKNVRFLQKPYSTKDLLDILGG
ncbi:response regulator [candidate division WOR-3 bacterium]|nr:response regulator [candidate division WOR-3 bacterium]